MVDYLEVQFNSEEKPERFCGEQEGEEILLLKIVILRWKLYFTLLFCTAETKTLLH